MNPKRAPSVRGQTAPTSPIRKLTPFADAARSRGVHVYHLNIGQPDIATPRVMLDAYRSYDQKVLAYGPSEGLLPYRKGLAAHYTRVLELEGVLRIVPEQILVTTGGSEALLVALAVTCDPGDEVLFAEPFYPNYNGYAHTLSLQARVIPTSAADRFILRAEQVQQAIGPRTRALMVSTPGNPSGAVLPADELAAIAKVCEDNGVFFICDEVYRDFVYAPGVEMAASVLAVPDVQSTAIMIDSVSKRYSACGARVGCLVTRNPDLIATGLKFAQMRLCPPVVDQIAALAALDTPAAEMRQVIDEYRRRRDTLIGDLERVPGVRVTRPEGAFYLIVHLPVDDAEAFCIFLLSEFSDGGETVMFAPGNGFYATPGAGNHEVRAAYVLEVPKLRRAVELLRAGLVAYAERSSGSTTA